MATTFLQTKQPGNANLDAVFDPYVQGTSPPATALLNDAGVDIASNIFAPIAFGTAAAATGLLTEQAGNADINTLFAAKGTAKYNLPIDGTNYTATQNGVNGSAQLIFSMKSDGTYSITKSIRGIFSTLATGTWLPTGDSVSNYTCYFSGTQSGVTQIGDSGFNNITNAPSPTQVALTTTRTYTADSDTFTNPGANATQDVAVVCNYYRLGVLVHQVHVGFHTVATS